jgi:hypothetical protein
MPLLRDRFPAKAFFLLCAISASAWFPLRARYRWIHERIAPGTTLEYVASAFNGWQAVKIGSQVGWVSGEYSEITTE